MINQRKKDYLQRLIEEFFAKLQALYSEGANLDDARSQLNDCLRFFVENFDTKQSDSLDVLVQKINNAELLEQYAKLLLTKYRITTLKEIDQIETALAIVEYLQKTDSTYSWDRTVLREDLLKALDEDTIV